jgi:hypothetical protein
MRLLLLFIAFLCFGCGFDQRDQHSDGKQLSLFIIPEYKDSFRLSVADTLHFSSVHADNEKHGPQELITKIDKPTDTVKIRLEIAGRDTLFVLDVKKVDSLIFGLDMNRRFFAMNQDQYIWYYD